MRNKNEKIINYKYNAWQEMQYSNTRKCMFLGKAFL